MRLCWIAANQEDRLGVMDVIIAVGHGAIAPCVGHTGHRCRMTNPRLMINVIGSPIGRKFAEQICLFVAMFRTAQPINAVRSAFFADVHHAVADFINRLIPADALPFTTLFFHRVFQSALTMCCFTNCSTFRAMCTKVEWAIPSGLLTSPNTILNFCHNRASD